MTGGWGDGSGVAAHLKSPDCMLLGLSLGETGIVAGCGRVRDIWGRFSSTGGGDDNDRHVPSGRGRRSSFRYDGRN